MNTVKPTDLTEPQWLLLRHLQKCNTPFYTEFLYAQFSKYEIERILFYKMFFSLAALNYIQLIGHSEQVPGHKQDFCYIVSAKGKRVVAEYTRTDDKDDLTQPAPKVHTSGMITARFARTVQLKDYSINH